MEENDMSQFFDEFKKFIMRGNVVDMAVGVIVGSAFSGIVNSLVNDIVMPVVSIFTGKINFSDLMISLNGEKYESLLAAKEVSAPVIAYGNFIQLIIQFLLTALVVFIMVKGLNKLHKKPEAAPEPAPTTKQCPYCKSDIHIEAVKCPHCASDVE